MFKTKYRLAGRMDKFRALRFLIKRGFTKLGEGCFGEVWAKEGSNFVVKMPRHTRTNWEDSDDGWLAYAKWVMAQPPNPHLPVIHSLHVYGDFYIAVMERLDMTVWEAMGSRFGTAYQPHTKTKTAIYRYADRLDESEPVLQNLPEKLRQMVVSFTRAFRSTAFDLHEENFMLRKDRTLVMIDPISSDVPVRDYAVAV